MAGSSIAGPDAAGWVTDFLNAAYYARPDSERHVRDLRRRHGIITTRWATRATGRSACRRVRVQPGVRAAALAPGRAALEYMQRCLKAPRDYSATGLPTRGSTTRGGLLRDRVRDGRPAPDVRPRAAVARRCAGPAHAAAEHRIPTTWATYDPVALPDPDAALELLGAPGRWPDIGCAGGRFTPLRGGGLLGQTFEIEVVAEPAPRSPLFTRGYVTCTTLVPSRPRGRGRARSRHRGAPRSLCRRRAAGREPDLARRRRAARARDPHHARRPLPRPGAVPPAGLARPGRRLDPRRRSLGSLALHLAAAYKAAGRAAQREFWGPGSLERSMLAQLARVSAEGFASPTDT